MSEPTHVVGFVFNPCKTQVLLIRKLKPPFQAGKLNGLGGAIEPTDLSPFEAMSRELKEESGLELGVGRWRCFGTLTHRKCVVELFVSFDGDPNILLSPRPEEKEQVDWYNVHDLPRLETMKNLRWLIPAALDPDEVSLTIIDPT